MDLSPEDVDLPTLPVFLLHSLACGATCVIPDADLRHPGTVDPSRVLTQMDREGVNCSSGSPAFFARLADKLVKDGEQFHGLKRLFIGGARVPSPLLRKLAQVFPAAEVHVVYGSTEAEPIAVLDATQGIDELEEGEAEGRGILVGTPVPSVDVQVLDDEICVAGAHVNPGYLDDPVATASHKIREPLPQGGERIWHRTGDAGFLDDQGRIWLVGRTGQNVAGHWPFQVESRAERLDFVHRAGLVSLEGQATLGVVLVDPPQDWHELLLAQTGLPGIRIESMPLDPRHNAKINRPALIALLDQARAEPTAPN
jgi:acyl-CoA synthetase (AMP-forming)/AMP-acid ligase II